MPPKKKKLAAIIKLQIKAGAANPAPPVGPALARMTGEAEVGPALLERVTSVVEDRRAGLERTKMAVVTPVAVQEAKRTLLSRVQQFLRLPGRA